MRVQVKINERGALRNGRFAFTNKFTLISELLQNGRRANATEVHVDNDTSAQRLIVSDNGCGIEDFQRLLTFNESGWDDATVQTEHPFGLGFSKCLYAAKHVTVTSRGMRLAFDCEAALDQAELDVVPATDAAPGITTVCLDGVELPNLDNLIDRITRGFSIKVLYNGAEQARSHSITAKRFISTEIGLAYLSGAETGEPATATALYLQGQLVGTVDRTFYCDHRNVDVIHLDPTRFMARMPDRTELIDAEDQSKVIGAALKQLWLRVLIDKKQRMPAGEFVERYYRVANGANLLHVLDDVPVVPRQACSVVGGYPTIADSEEAYLEQPRKHPTREDVRSRKVRVAAFDPHDDDESLATLMYARAASLTLVHSYQLGESHWVSVGLRDLNAEEVTVAPVGVTAHAEFSGIYVDVKLILCEKIEIRYGGDVAEITDEALYHDDAILYPSGCWGGEAVKQVSRYTGEFDHFDDTACDADMQQLARLVRTLRCNDAASVLKCLLQDLRLTEYPSLHGKTFRVTLGSSAEEASVDLVS